MMGKIGKRIGAVIRDTARSAAALWHKLTPFINRLGKTFFRELGPIGLEIVKNAVLVAIQSGLNGEDARQVAIEEAKRGLSEAKLEVRDRALNFVLEVFFNKETKTI